MAAHYGHRAVVSLLCEFGAARARELARADGEFANGHTPLYLAAQAGHEDIVRDLLKGYRASIDIELGLCRVGWTPRSLSSPGTAGTTST